MKWFVLVIAIVLPCVTATMTEAQMERELQIGLSYILSLGGVNKELELTDEQAYNVDDLWIEIRDDLQAEFGKFAQKTKATMPPEERESIEAELRSAIEKIRDKELKRLNDVLLPHQVERLKQIHVQFLKRRAAGFEQIAKDLQLTGVQKKKIKELGGALEKHIKKLTLELRNGNVSQLDVARQIKELRKENEKKLLDILTPSQRKNLKELQGESFEFQTSESQKENRDKSSLTP